MAVCDGVGVGGSVLITDGRGVQVLVLVGERTIVFVGVITVWAVPVQLARIKLAMIRSKTAILEFTVWTRFLGPPAEFASRKTPGRLLKQTRRPLERGGIHSQLGSYPREKIPG